MSINSVLASPDLRAPVFVFEFVQGPLSWRYSNGEDITVNGAFYTHNVVSISKLSRSTSESTADVEIVLPSSDEVVRIFDSFLPVEPVVCTVRSVELNDTTNSFRVVLSGNITGITDNDDGTSVAKVKPIYQRLNASIPWQVQQTTCVLPLYGVQCGVSPDNFKTTAVGLSAMDNLSVTSPQFAIFTDPTWFQAGYIRCRRTREIRFIQSQDATGKLYIAYPFDQSNVTDTFDAYAGCQRTGAICQNKFNNKKRFMGFEKIPVTNVFKTGLKN